MWILECLKELFKLLTGIVIALIIALVMMYLLVQPYPFNAIYTVSLVGSSLLIVDNIQKKRRERGPEGQGRVFDDRNFKNDSVESYKEQKDQ